MSGQSEPAGGRRPWPADQIEHWPIERLTPYANNPRRRSEADLDKLKAAIAPLVPYDLTAMTVKSLAAFPMTPTGKIAKAQLRESALAGDGAQEFPRSSN